MNLDYNILWVDDRIEEFKDLGYDERLETYLENLFFTPFLITCESVEEAEICANEFKFDLILSDYNIDVQGGDDFIRKIRTEYGVTAEILFYSGRGDPPGLREDRISFISLASTTGEGYDRLYEKTIKLVDLTIEKLQELKTLRGIVMGETSQLDNLMEEIIKHYFVDAGEDRHQLFNKIIDFKENSIKKKLAEPAENGCTKECNFFLKSLSIEDAISHKEFESSSKAYAINKIVKAEHIDLEGLRFYNKYLSEIINVRNNLAHSRSGTKNGREVLIVKTSVGEEEIYYDQEMVTEIRRNIKKYNSIFEKIKEAIGFSN